VTEETIGPYITIALIISAVGIFVGARIWMVFRK